MTRNEAGRLGGLKGMATRLKRERRLNDIAQQLATIMTEHLMALSPDDRASRLRAGEVIMRRMMKRVEAHRKGGE